MILIHIYNDEPHYSDNVEIFTYKATTPIYNFEIPKENGKYTFNNFSTLTDSNISISNGMGDFKFPNTLYITNTTGNMKNINITADNSIEMYSDNNTELLVSLDTDNNKIGHAKNYELTLTNTPITISVDEDNNYIKTVCEIQEHSQKTFIGINFSMENGNVI